MRSTWAPSSFRGAANLSLSDTFTSGLVEAGDVAGDNDADPNDPNYPYCLNASPNNAFIDKLAGDTDDFLEPGETWVWQCAVASQSGSLAPVVNVAFIRDSVTSTESSTCSASVTPFEPTLAILSGARAYASADGVQVEWETGIEAQTLGFHVERQDPGSDDFVRLTWDMLPAVLRGQGGRYRFLDQGAPGGEATYRLIEVEIDGNERVIGTFGLSEDMASESVPRAAPNGGAWTGAAHGARAWNGAAPARRDRNGFNAEERQPSEKAVERAKRAREAKADARESLRRLQEGAR